MSSRRWLVDGSSLLVQLLLTLLPILELFKVSDQVVVENVTSVFPPARSDRGVAIGQ